MTKTFHLQIMFKEANLGGIEASFPQMRQANFWPDLDDLHQDAIQLYDHLKYACYQHGHTFEYGLKFRELGRSSRKYCLTDVGKALEFLKDNEIVHCDVEEDKRYHLMRFWKAEEKIAGNLKRLIDRHKDFDFTAKVDLDGEAFERINSDPEQRKASEMILRNPITVMSGRGGTGKTEVVTTVLNCLEEAVKKEQAVERVKHEENDLLFSDDSADSDIFEKSNLGDEVREKNTFDILYTAPTGKAASVIGRRAKKKAFTIHQIWAAHKMDNFSKFEKTRVLVVDETSMVSLEVST